LCFKSQKTCVHTSIVASHPALVYQWHPSKNGDKKPEHYTAGSNEMIWWKCQIGCSEGCAHEWQARICHRVSKDTGCPYCCSNRQKFCIHESIAYTHPELAKEWHPIKNIELKPTDIVSGSEKRIWWRCSKNPIHEWIARPALRCSKLTQSGCPYCVNKTEDRVYKFILNYYPVERQFLIEGCRKINPLPFDMCLPGLLIIVEVDGKQHFSQVKLWGNIEEIQKRDIFKMRKAEEAGYIVIRISQEDVFRGGEAWLEKVLLPVLNSICNQHVYLTTNTGLYDKHKELYEKSAGMKTYQEFMSL
jgi:very-short-patch-repair endonuclease